MVKDDPSAVTVTSRSTCVLTLFAELLFNLANSVWRNKVSESKHCGIILHVAGRGTEQFRGARMNKKADISGTYKWHRLTI